MSKQLRRLRNLGLLAGRDDDAEEIVDDWTETLWAACLPITLVADCFQRAVEVHEGTRALTPSEVIRQWREVQGGVKDGAHTASADCAACEGRGMKYTQREVGGMLVTGLVPCDCQVGQAKRRHLEKSRRDDE